MTKSELIARLAQRYPQLVAKDAEYAVKMILDAMTQSLLSGHRIEIRSEDQLAALESSFNSMTASLEKLIQEQKEKQRLENELAIAQEVQAQLFPREAADVPALELHGICRPARTVSGDYYDFLPLEADKVALAVAT